MHFNSPIVVGPTQSFGLFKCCVITHTTIELTVTLAVSSDNSVEQHMLPSIFGGSCLLHKKNAKPNSANITAT